MQTLTNNIKLVSVLTAGVVDETTTTTGIDTHGNGSENFDSALVMASIGAITGTPTSVKIKVVESDSSNMSGATLAKGGDEITVSQNTMYSFQINRSKRYLAVVATITGGTTPEVIVSVNAILNNWATPYPIIN